MCLNELESICIAAFRAFQVIQVVRIKFRVAFLAFPHVSVPVLMDLPPDTHSCDDIWTGGDGN